jgi:integral membrane protein
VLAVKKALKIVAVLEAASFLVLLVATAVKYGADNEAGVKVMGPVHGGLFVAYVFLTIVVAADEKWRLNRTLLTLLCAVIPLGGFIADRKLIGPTDPTPDAA